MTVVTSPVTDAQSLQSGKVDRLGLYPAVQTPDERVRILGDPTQSPLARSLHAVGGIVSTDSPEIRLSHAPNWQIQEVPGQNQSAVGWNSTPEVSLSATFRWSFRSIDEGLYGLAVLKWFTSITKGHVGIRDSHAGMPPDLLSLRAYGHLLLFDVPVVVTSWSTTLGNDGDMLAVPVASGGDRTGAVIGLVPATLEIQVEFAVSRSGYRWLRQFTRDRMAAGDLMDYGGWL